VSLIRPCSGCGQREPGKNANVTFAWFTTENRRVAYRLSLCMNCYVVNVHELDVKTETNGVLCPTCGQDAGTDMDPCYITAYVPGYGKRQIEMPTCGVDAAELRAWFGDHGETLPDAGFGGQGPGPQTGPPPATDWASAGLRWRE
jgi:hypothetical protein